jgi:hypothetical protein
VRAGLQALLAESLVNGHKGSTNESAPLQRDFWQALIDHVSPAEQSLIRARGSAWKEGYERLRRYHAAPWVHPKPEIPTFDEVQHLERKLIASITKGDFNGVQLPEALFNFVRTTPGIQDNTLFLYGILGELKQYCQSVDNQQALRVITAARENPTLEILTSALALLEQLS